MEINDALDINSWPVEFRQYLQEEVILVERVSSGRVLDVGCGKGRVIQLIADKVESYTGVDVDEKVLENARKVAKSYSNATLVNKDARDIVSLFGEKYFDTVLCLFNTIGAMPEPKKVLEQISKVSKKKILITLAAKGQLNRRIKYYQALEIEYSVNDKTETITSHVWGESKAYSFTDLEKIAKLLKSKIIEKGTIADLMIYGIFERF